MRTVFTPVARIIVLAFVIVTAMVTSSGAAEKKPAQQQEKERFVINLTGIDQLNAALETAGNRLLMFDLYADWCMPCRLLSPMLETIAAKHRDRVTVYAINVDTNPEIAAALQVSGLPFVLYVKNKQAVHALMGLQTKDTYVRAINLFAETEDTKKKIDQPDGMIVEGVREIRLTTATSPGDLYVYRGDEVRLIVEKVSFPYSVHIPDFNVSQEAEIGKDLVVTFKALEVGVFPIFCNGDCPAGDGSRYGRIIVMQFKAPGNTTYTEVDARQAAKIITEKKPLILDVRTPGEFYQGAIKDAKLIPIQQLDHRITEIDEYKDRAVLLYCRSGNRSTVAAEILVKHGFKELYNIRTGVKGLEKAGIPFEKKRNSGKE